MFKVKLLIDGFWVIVTLYFKNSIQDQADSKSYTQNEQ